MHEKPGNDSNKQGRSNTAGPVFNLMTMKTTQLSPISEIASNLCGTSLSTPTTTKRKATLVCTYLL